VRNMDPTKDDKSDIKSYQRPYHILLTNLLITPPNLSGILLTELLITPTNLLIMLANLLITPINLLITGPRGRRRSRPCGRWTPRKVIRLTTGVISAQLINLLTHLLITPPYRGTSRMRPPPPP